MAKQRPQWPVQYPSQSAAYAFFISHVREDESEVAALKRAIESASSRFPQSTLACFLDTVDWPRGRPDMEVIRDRLMQSRQVVAWITPAYLKSLRGWVWVELTYAHLLELSLNQAVPRETTLQYVVPVFRGVTLQDVERTPWFEYWKRGLTQPGENLSINALAEHLVQFSISELDRRSRFLK